MIIFGWKVRRKTLSEGMFFSPAAGQDAPYRLIEARKWFSIFFIPLIPLSVIGTFVECQLTKATYDPAVLDNPTNADFLVQLSAAVREVVALVVTADGPPTDREREAAVRAVRGYVENYDASLLAWDLSAAASSHVDARLTYLASALDERGKEQVVTAAAKVVAADGVIGDAARSVISSVGQKLSMSAAHVRGVLDTVAALSDGQLAD